MDQRTVTDSVLIASQAMTNSATVTANLDTAGSAYADIIINLASEINTNAVGPTLSLLESDDTAVSNFATVTANLAAVAIVTAQSATYGVDLRGRKRYLRLSVTTGTTTNDDVTVGAIARLSRKAIGPATTASSGDVVTYV